MNGSGDQVQISTAGKLFYSAVEDVNGDEKALEYVTVIPSDSCRVKSNLSVGFLNINNITGSDLKLYTPDDGLSLTSNSTDLIYQSRAMGFNITPFSMPSVDILMRPRPISSEDIGAYEFY